MPLLPKPFDDGNSSSRGTIDSEPQITKVKNRITRTGETTMRNAIGVLAMMFLTTVVAQAQAPAKEAAKPATNLSPEFSKAAFMWVEAINNGAPTTRKDELKASAKFAASSSSEELANDGIDFLDFTATSVWSVKEKLFDQMYGADKFKKPDYLAFNATRSQCIREVETQLKSRNWTDMPKACSLDAALKDK
jgi:hypothetical protein